MRLGTLYFVLSAGLGCFIMGVCASEAVVETFWPQVGDVIGIRAVGGSAGLAAFALALRLMPRWFIRRASLYGLVCTALIVVGVLVRLAFAWSQGRARRKYRRSRVRASAPRVKGGDFECRFERQ